MLLITSSRKPSFKTKILCKKLALFCDAVYMTRGKMPLSEVLERGEGCAVLIVGEFHGNPGSFSFYDHGSRLFLSARFSETSFDPVPQAELRYGEKIFYGSDSSALFRLLNTVVFEDRGTAADLVLIKEFLNARKRGSGQNNLDAGGTDDAGDIRAVSCIGDTKIPQGSNAGGGSYVRRLYIRDDRLDFYSNDRLFLRLYIKGIKPDSSDARPEVIS